MKKQVLLLDDDKSFLKLTQIFLQKRNWEVEAYGSWEDAKKAYTEKSFAVVVVDINIGNQNGLQVVEELKKQNPRQAIVVITGHSSVETAISSIRLGVSDYITKPCENEEILLRLENLFNLIHKDEEIEALKNEIAGRHQFHNILTRDERMMLLCELAQTIASTDSTVLIQGETGTGKELFAKAIHYESTRRDEPFIIVNCAGINENLLESHLFGHVKGSFTGAHETVKGKFEVVGKGTIFLDEISETSLNFQKRFLRVLEEKTFEKVGDSKSIICEARILAASNKDLLKMVQSGDFRKDLFYRLNVVPINIPPLRDRHNDIPLLAKFFLDKYTKKYNRENLVYTSDLETHLLSYKWPGNVRELEHYIEKLVLTTFDGNIKWELVQFSAEQAFSKHRGASNGDYNSDFQTFTDQVEKAYFSHLIDQYEGNISKVAEHAKTAKKTVYAKIKKYQLRF